MLRLLRFQRASTAEASRPTGQRAVDPLYGLATAAARGDRAAERTLLVSVGPAVLRTVRAVLGANDADLEDVVQDTMAALHGALPAFRGECQTLHFACRVAVQTAMNARRRRRYRERHTQPASPEELIDLARDERSPAEARAVAARRATLRRLLDELPAPQAEALVMHVMLGYSVEETASATGAPHNTVRSRLRAALSSLRERIAADSALLDDLDARP